MTAPLMPKATAVWLVENTTLTFRQIATFCELHELEIQAIADGDVAYNIIGISPIANNQLTIEEIHRCEADETADLVANKQENNVKIRNFKTKKLLSPNQRNDKPSAILWIIKNCPEIMDSQICKLIGTTKPTIMAIRNGTHRNMAEIKPKNPIAIGLCTEKDLDSALTISKSRMNPKVKKKTKKKKAKKTTAKKVVAKKTAKTVKKKTEKKAPVKKTAKATKPEKKKATEKKAHVKKTKKDATKKTTVVEKSKKQVAKRATAKKSAAKKPTAKKAAAKKTTVKKISTKKATPKKAATKKAVKKTSAKKAAK